MVQKEEDIVSCEPEKIKRFEVNKDGKIYDLDHTFIKTLDIEDCCKLLNS